MPPKLRTTKKQPEKENSVKTKSFNKKNVCVAQKLNKVVSRLKIKKKKKVERQYTTEDVRQALNALDEGYTLREAAGNFGVAKSTLFAKLKHFSTIDCRKGPSTVLSADEEDLIVKWILYCSEHGFPVTKTHLLNCVQKFLIDNCRKNPFKSSRPGKHWFNGFMRRHSHLRQRIAQNLTSTRASVTEEDLRQWFSNIRNYLTRKELLEIDSKLIFNLNESAFMLVPNDNTVITEKGVRAPYQIVAGNAKACLTALFVACTSGLMLPPMILYNLKKTHRKKVLEKVPKDWAVGNTESGSMKSESFYYYISNVFFKWLIDNTIERPAVLYVDGHSSHITLPLVQFCQENQIELIALYPNATHIIQPLNVSVFHSLKNTYRQVIREWRIDHNVINFEKYMFPEVLDLALKSIDLTSIIQNGFRACGLFPLNPEAVDYNVINKKRKR